MDVQNWRQPVANLLRGFLMGVADFIPGVSGGTVALVLGIYPRLVAAISHFDLTALVLVRRGRFRAAAERVDLAFLVCLLCGILTGIVSLAGLMHHLLTDPVTRPLSLAGLFGLIFASCVLVAKLVRRWTFPLATLAALAAGGAFLLTLLTGHEIEPSLPYLFLCGMIAISAMILPGISGAFILVLLGVYVHVAGTIKGLPLGQLSLDDLATLVVFGSGCLLGLILFSKFLKWLLARHEAPTMAVLGGFIFGALWKVWPFQTDLTPTVETLSDKQYQAYFPRSLDWQVAACLGIAFAAGVAVFLLDRVGNQRAELDKAEATLESEG